MSCLLVGAMAITLAGDAFRLDWQHSVERQGWREWYRITPQGLVLTRAAIRGSGAGMEPGEDAILQDGWWIWAPDLPPLPALTLAASGTTGGGWRICAPDGNHCHPIGAETGRPITLAPCGS